MSFKFSVVTHFTFARLCLGLLKPGFVIGKVGSCPGHPQRERPPYIWWKKM